jgi:serine/threonine-protein kinase
VKNTTAVTTRTMRSRRVPYDRTRHLLAPAQAVTSPETQLTYRIERFIGEGGFGQVFLAQRLGRSTTVGETVCIKISGRIDGWLREAYFGQLLDDHPRAIRIYDAFPMLGVDGEMFYCLAIEYAKHGDLRAFLRRAGKGWPERTVRREIAGILEVLGKLHRGQMLHRDLTPLNVFVCEGPALKLGDFGIVRQASDTRGITARTMNAMTAPSEILARDVPKWQARDDVYQVGQLLGMLVKGDASARLRPLEVRGLACSDHLKEIVYRCIGERRKRYESADEMIDALRHPPAELKTGALRTLKGAHLAFTGILSRSAAGARAARRRRHRSRRTVGADQCHRRGRPSKLQAAGKDAGSRLMEIKRLREKGHRITLLNEAQFWRLVTANCRGRASRVCSRRPPSVTRCRRASADRGPGPEPCASRHGLTRRRIGPDRERSAGPRGPRGHGRASGNREILPIERA